VEPDARRHPDDPFPASRSAQRFAARAATGSLGAAALAVAAFVWMDARPPRTGYAIQAPAGPSISAPYGHVPHPVPISESRSGGYSDAITTALPGSEGFINAVDRDLQRQQARTLLQKGRDAAARSNLADARAHFEGAIDLDPVLADARYGLAIVLIRMGEREAARRELDDLSELDLSLANLLSNLLR